MNVTKEKVTPKKALEYLKRNVGNRPLSRRRVSEYASAMKDGKWKLNGDAIRFNCNGDFIDGQHRLAAIIESGETIETYVVRGLPRDAFDTIDQGKLRTISDVFARQGHGHYTSLASAVRWLFQYNEGSWTRNRAMRPDEANAIVEKNPQLHECVHEAQSLGKEKLLQRGMLGFLIFECGRKDNSEALSFWTAVCTGEGAKRGTPAFLLRSRLIQDLGSKAKLSAPDKLAISIKAWNAHRTGSHVKCLKWSSDEQFPRIVH